MSYSRRNFMPAGAYHHVARTAYKAARAVAAAKAGASVMPERKKKVVKRTVTKATTVTRRRYRKVQDGAIGEYSKDTMAYGRPVKQNLRQAWKVIKNQMVSNIYNFSQYSQFAGTSGALNILNTSTTSTTGLFVPPIHIWDITACPNIVSGAASYPTVQWTPNWTLPTSAGTLSWVTSSTLSCENTDAATALTVPGAFPGSGDRLDWVNAKMIFYAPLSVPCRVQIDICQFTDVRVVPGESVTQFASAFWQGMTKKFAFSPLESGNTKSNRYIKVLHTHSFIMNPKESTEAVNTIFKEVNIFKRMNRQCNYSWQDNDTMNMLGQEATQNTNASGQSNVVHPRARVFMMIRAQARNATAYSNTVHPSYDIVLKLKHSQFSG